MIRQTQLDLADDPATFWWTFVALMLVLVSALRCSMDLRDDAREYERRERRILSDLPTQPTEPKEKQ